ncbi:hypothetical protein BO70DRAFT_419850 [Aspergillus heteromorphus CBS 117.55]|uniref:GXWXG domain-containing protein n=1 Tax=Aspergillus heteromorphus CBS 117.55 TaxID=1448321 RepID=A0A317WQA5_9EURO|nr:uncharacterized protein BO70DRAFT_419850 [Aspergillus heteromorphus CBS 117.55]PWY88235.1 hypothetical protein BO70DRAFT_419850 [Aspergillus heteromorphus CBS 117.55]
MSPFTLSNTPNITNYSSPADEYIALTSALNQLTPAEVDDAYSKLPLAEPESLEGEWDVHVIDTGHPAHALAADILPLVNTLYSEEGVDKVHEVKFHGTPGGLFVSDNQQNNRRFRYVNGNMVAGTNDYKPYYGDSGVLHFYLTRYDDE